jgi:DnaJ-class molecular chaperone
MEQDKFYELDKRVSKEIMKEFKGVQIDSVCYKCNGEKEVRGVKCENCNGEGHYVIEY